MPGLPKPPRPPGAPRSARGSGRRPPFRRRLLRWVLASAVVAVLLLVAAGYATFHIFAGMIDDRLHGERERTVPRIYARPVELRRGQALSSAELVVRLNDLGYAQRVAADRAASFAVTREGIDIRPRGGPLRGRVVRASLTGGAATGEDANRAARASGQVRTLEVLGLGQRDSVELDAPLLTALPTSGAREKRRHVPLSAIPPHVQQAVLAIEDQSFYSHPGINPFPVLMTLVSNAVAGGDRPLATSTITQQLARMFFLSDEFHEELERGERSYWRKAREGLMSLVLERRASKSEILELYLNDVYLGQRGSFAIRGVAEAARTFFGKDVSNLTIAEAAVIAGVIQSPASRSPFSNPARAVDRRNVVIRAMANEDFITADQAARATREPLRVVARAVDNDAPYFVDLIRTRLNATFPGVTERSGPVEIYTTLDLNLQRAALEAVRRGLEAVDARLARRKRKGSAQAALIAVDPKTGDILAMVGGRSYNQSQFNRATAARRQPGSVFKPFVFLAAFEAAAEEGRVDLTPASIAFDEPAIFEDAKGQPWEPRNYDEYDGPITWRRALAMSRNLATIQVGALIGFDRVAALWRRVGVGSPPQPYPSIALGVFELTPLEVAEAYTLFVNGGAVRPLRGIARVEAGGRALTRERARVREVASATSTFLVTNMMRAVVNEGTGAGARAQGFTHDAAGKTGTTNDLRDAWFAGFTPDLLTVVWVGYDDNQPLSRTGGQAALPIWTDFMKSALAGRASKPFHVPDGITFVDIDRESGMLPTESCPHVITEAFQTGTEPVEYCPLEH